MVAAAATLLGNGSVASAAENTAEEAPSIWRQETFLGDRLGLRTAMSDRGVDLEIRYINEGFGVLSGGIHDRASYEGLLELSADVDFEKLMGWRGASAHVTGFNIHDGGRNAADNVGGIADPSNIDAFQTTRLYNFWLQQTFFDDRLSLRIGHLGLDLHVFLSHTSGELIDGDFGWPSVFQTNMINGGPAYPLAAPGALILSKPTEDFTILAAVLSGDPAGPSCLDEAEVCNQHGTEFGFTGGVLAAGEAAYAINHGDHATGLPGIYRLGFWYASADFPDQRYGRDASGAVVPLADPSVAGPLDHSGNGGIYGVIDQTVWQRHERRLSVFVRGSISPSDRNLISHYVDGGAGFKGLLPARPDDVLTLGVSYAKISSDAVAADRDALAINGPPQPIRDHEMVFEMTYALQIAPWWIVQPDVQYIIHPGGNVPNPENPDVEIDNAFIVGLRSTFTF